MDMLDRLLGYDRWETLAFLHCASSLTDDQLDQEFDIGHRTVRKTFAHLIDVLHWWTAPLDGTTYVPYDVEKPSPAQMQADATKAYDAFDRAARAVYASEDPESYFVDAYGFPQTRAGTVLHVITHNVAHQSEIRHMLVRLGVEGLPDGDLQEWEHFTGYLDSLGAPYPEGFEKPWAKE